MRKGMQSIFKSVFPRILSYFKCGKGALVREVFCSLVGSQGCVEVADVISDLSDGLSDKVPGMRLGCISLMDFAVNRD